MLVMLLCMVVYGSLVDSIIVTKIKQMSRVECFALYFGLVKKEQLYCIIAHVGLLSHVIK